MARFCELEPGPELRPEIGTLHGAEARAIFDVELLEGKEVRYSISIVWDDRRPLLFGIGFNPSVARPNGRSDQTVAKVVGFARRAEAYGGIFWTNLGGQMETNPNIFIRDGLCPGAWNEEQLRRVLDRLHPEEEARDVLIAWGWDGPTISDWRSTASVHSDVRLMTIGIIRGKPRHPSRTPYLAGIQPLAE